MKILKRFSRKQYNPIAVHRMEETGYGPFPAIILSVKDTTMAHDKKPCGMSPFIVLTPSVSQLDEYLGSMLRMLALGSGMCVQIGTGTREMMIRLPLGYVLESIKQKNEDAAGSYVRMISEFLRSFGSGKSQAVCDLVFLDDLRSSPGFISFVERTSVRTGLSIRDLCENRKIEKSPFDSIRRTSISSVPEIGKFEEDDEEAPSAAATAGVMEQDPTGIPVTDFFEESEATEQVKIQLVRKPFP